jgi:hypothetical protein
LHLVLKLRGGGDEANQITCTIIFPEVFTQLALLEFKEDKDSKI